MRYLLGLLLGIMVLSTVALADIMVPSVFTQEFARALAKAMPSASVKVTGDMQVTVKAASGREWGVFLGNTYQDYKRDPSLFDEIVQAYAARLTPPPAAQSELDRARIVPVIKDRKWLADLHSSLKAKGVEQEHLSERFRSSKRSPSPTSSGCSRRSKCAGSATLCLSRPAATMRRACS
jgi:hypothetical protein